MNTGSYTSLLVRYVFSEMCVVTLNPAAAAYKYSCRWWEALVMLRKLFLKIVAIFVVNPILKGVQTCVHEHVYFSFTVWQSQSHYFCPPIVVAVYAITWQPPWGFSFSQGPLCSNSTSDRTARTLAHRIIRPFGCHLDTAVYSVWCYANPVTLGMRSLG